MSTPVEQKYCDAADIDFRSAAAAVGRPPSPKVSDRLRTLMANNLLNNEEAAAYLDITPGTLEVWRCTKRHIIPYIKVGRLVKYRQASLDAFLESQTVEC